MNRHCISTYRRPSSRRKYWIHVLIIFSLYCVASEMDFREQSAHYSQVQR